MKKTTFFILCILCIIFLTQNIMANNVNGFIYEEKIGVEFLGVGPGTGGNYKEVRVTVYRSATDTYENRYYYNDGYYSGYISIYTVNKIPDPRTNVDLLEIVYKGIVYINS